MANQLRSTVRLDDVKSVYTGHVFSVRAGAELENGFVVKVGDIEANNRDVREAVAPVAGDSVAVIAQPAIVYDNARLGTGQEKYFYINQDEVVNAYEVQKGDIFSVSELGVNGTAVVGEYLITGAGYKLVPSATPATSGFTAKVVRFDTVGGALSLNVTQSPTKYVVLDVISN